METLCRHFSDVRDPETYSPTFAPSHEVIGLIAKFLILRNRIFYTSMAAVSCGVGGVKRLLIGITLLPSRLSRRQVSGVYRNVRDSRNIWQATINTTRRYQPVSLASTFSKPAVAPIFVRSSSSSSFCKLKMVNSVETASVGAESNGCDNGHSAGQEVLVDTAASFKEIQIPLSWGHLAGMYRVCSFFVGNE